jgi:GWxTD domain-containing protein
VGYIITDEERSAFMRLQTDEEREQFIENFWVRRDPTPNTPQNEYRDEHYRRIAFANAQFNAGVSGWKTDRGRIYIVYGPPDQIEDHGKIQDWTYRWMEGVGTNVTIEFVDRDGYGDFRMTTDPNGKMKPK